MKLVYAVRDSYGNLCRQRFDSPAKAIKFARKLNAETQLDDEIDEQDKHDCTVEILY